MSSSDIGEVGAGLAGMLILGAGAAAGIGLIALTVGAGWALRQGASYAAEGYQRARASGERRARERQERVRQREEEARQRLADRAWTQTRQALQLEIDAVETASEREALSASLEGMEAPFRAALDREDGAAAESAINDLRQRISSVRTEERMLSSQGEALSRLLSRLERDAPSGFASEVGALRKEEELLVSGAIEERARRTRDLLARAQRLAGEAAQASAIPLESLEEEALFIPPAQSSAVHPNANASPEGGESRDETGPQSASLVADICDFGARVAFFDQREAEALKPLIAEARGEGVSAARLHLIRDQVKASYGRLKEQTALTDLFKGDLRDFLPPMRRAQGEAAERLRARMERLLEARVVTREEYADVYKAVRVTLEDQAEAIADALLAERVEAVLGGMGYALLDEEGADLRPGKMYTLATPYDGYRVQVKVSDEGRIATRFVRVVGSEEERDHVSEYQRQKDVEAGRKWCQDLQRFYGTLEEEGLLIESAFRKEPEEEVVVLVDSEAARPAAATQTSGQVQARLQERMD